jgi:hypothetical protein
MEKLIKQLKLIYLRLTLSEAEYMRILSLEDNVAKYMRTQRKLRREQIKSNRNFQKANSRKVIGEELRNHWKYRAREKKANREAELFKIYYTRWFGDEIRLRTWSKK